MPSLSLEEALKRLGAGEALSGDVSEAGASIVFDPAQPYIAAAIHDGSGFEADLEPYCRLAAEERLFEEDPHTGELVQGLPNRIVGLDSRYEYDLNRAPEECLYDRAWGRVVWSEDLPEELSERSLRKHAAFHRLFEAMVQALLKRHKSVAVYDVHSYNGERRGGAAAPTFNLGTEQIDLRRYRRVCDHLVRLLDSVQIDGEPLRTARNEVFFGRGYLAARCRQISPNVLCLPIEVKKFFCDEQSGGAYPQILTQLKQEMTRVIAESAAYFCNRRGEAPSVSRHDMLSSALDRNILEIDRKLFALTRRFETLLYVNPINIDRERAAFFARKGRYEPEFRYRKLEIDPFLFKETLYRLPIETIADATVQALFRRAIEGLSQEIDMLATIGSRQCLYNSLRHYGEPAAIDLDNAKFLLHAPSVEDEESEGALLSDVEVAKRIQAEVDAYRIDAPVQLSTRIVAGAMVDNSNYRVLVRKGARQSSKAVDALKHHEVGVHLFTASEARRQPLRLFRLGLPGATETQEGLAVLAEYLSGNLTVDRLKTLGLRVVAVRCLIDDFSFSRTFDLLVEQHGASHEKAFTVATRVFRGGGFTKDYLYLRGLARAYHYWRSERPWAPLLVGKAAFDDAEAIEELLGRDILSSPERLPTPFATPAKSNPIYAYLLSGLRLPSARLDQAVGALVPANAARRCEPQALAL